MKVKINKSVANGIIQAQPSKSYAHRLLIASSLTKEQCIISNVIISNDILATLNCIKTLGKDVTITGDNKKTIIIKNNDNYNIMEKEELIFDCLESGSTLRFFIPIALLLNKTVIFTGTEKLISRGIKIYEDICEKQNIEIEKEKTQIKFKGCLKPDIFNIEGNISSQFISGLLFALPLLNKDSCINICTEIESKNYIDITIDVLKQAGIKIVNENNKYYISSHQQYHSINTAVEGDYSNSAFIEAFNYLQGNVLIQGLNEDSYQGDKNYLTLFKRLNQGYCECDIKNCIDLGPILFCFSALKHGGCFTGVKRLRIKESDRISDIKDELEKFNIEFIEEDNKVIIHNQNITKPKTTLNGKNDHRIVMALSIMLTVYGGEIDGIEAINKSYPDFFNDLQTLGIEVTYDK